MVRPIDTAEVDRLITPDKCGFILGAFRRGSRAFLTLLEHRHFRPGTPLNADFFLLRIFWEELVWFIAIIPAAKSAEAEALLHELKLRAVNGVPFVFSSKGSSNFPVQSLRLRTVENEGEAAFASEAEEDKYCDRLIADFAAGIGSTPVDKENRREKAPDSQPVPDQPGVVRDDTANT